MLPSPLQVSSSFDGRCSKVRWDLMTRGLSVGNLCACAMGSATWGGLGAPLGTTVAISRKGILSDAVFLFTVSKSRSLTICHTISCMVKRDKECDDKFTPSHGSKKKFINIYFAVGIFL